VSESGTGARAALVGLVVGALLAGVVVRGTPGPPLAAAATVPGRPAGTGTAPVAVPPTPTTARPTTTTTRLLPAPPRAKPAVLPAGHPAPVLSRVPTADKVVFLAIDDGQVRDPAVLDHLEANHLPFTVFLTMGPAQEDPAFWRRAVAAGGTIESHTLTHPDLTQVGGATLRNEVCGTLEPYQALSGRRPTLFRPPFGKVSPAVQRQAAECGYRAVVLWKGSTNNGHLTMQEGPLQAGDILLLHWRDTLRDDIDDVVARCRQEGFTIARLEDYLP
jgi:peptidoglycan/xylan/chitin deacetylase (PgdA/CDA1 family)